MWNIKSAHAGVDVNHETLVNRSDAREEALPCLKTAAKVVWRLTQLAGMEEVTVLSA